MWFLRTLVANSLEVPTIRLNRLDGVCTTLGAAVSAKRNLQLPCGGSIRWLRYNKMLLTY